MQVAVVIGGRGMLGRATCRYLSKKGFEVHSFDREKWDLAREPSADRLKDIVSSGDLVVNCSGIIMPMIEKNSVEALRNVNAIFPRNLAAFCRSQGARCFHITTDAVFTGSRGGYTEEDPLEPKDLYATSKAEGESPDAMVLRTSIIGEEELPGRSLLSWAQSQAGKEIRGYTNQYWNGVTTLQLARTLDEIYQRGLYKPGIFHLYSPNKLSKFELLQSINRVYELNLKINPVESKDFCDRTLSSHHSLSRDLIRDPIETQLLAMREFFRE